ncbi:MAG: hypothetical protein A2X49_12580 [Lentisphaerae bacterium GWF2_52_8]|nr:MAG: hypothetical protein A2X49_12580 [Lentisphaerae bacterium GWF2_52_8]
MLTILVVLGVCGIMIANADEQSYPEKCVAQLEKKTAKEESEKTGLWRKHLLENALKVKSDIEREKQWVASPLAVYSVPAMSPHKHLPDTYPIDGKISSQLRTMGAKGEVYSISFIVFPFKDIDSLSISVSDLKGEKGTIPASAVDVKVVKCWYQAGTAWHSYFADPSQAALIPELLLNDDSLVKVEHETQSNYLRLDYPSGSEYVWMSYPESIAPKKMFNPLFEPFADSPKFMPVKFDTGEFKQFWLTISVPVKSSPGFYSGKISFNAAGEKIVPLDLNLRVLPFELPAPKTYYDLKSDFIVSMYHYFRIDALAKKVDNLEILRKQLSAEIMDMQNHNVRQHSIGSGKYAGIYVKAMKEANLDLSTVIGPFEGERAVHRKEINPEDWKNFVEKNEKLQNELKNDMPGTHFYALGVDEAGYSTLTVENNVFKYFAEKGLSIYATAHLKNLLKAGIYNVDVLATPTHPEEAKEEARITHAARGKILVYGSPHSGVENPAFIRRTHGLMPYMSDFDGVRECGYSPGMTWCNSWNDFQYFDGFRINFTYPTNGGVIDTLHWEGFREGINDVRYATRLCQVSQEAIASGKVENRYAARQALQYLATLDWQSADLDSVRLELISRILKIQGLLEGSK